MSSTITNTVPDHEAVAVRAYFIWEAEGGVHGRHEAHWLVAEAAEKRSQTARRSAATRRAKLDAASKVAPKGAAKLAPTATSQAVVAAAAVSEARGTAARASRRVH